VGLQCRQLIELEIAEVAVFRDVGGTLALLHHLEYSSVLVAKFK
jgi:hypothetical protein